ncbi:50S ribosomal protein L10 [Patescibacteria group bacterium]|nr:50S ribosomal protein L10 [Patescibacteria group bacterium]
MNTDNKPNVSQNRAKKVAVVAEISEKVAKSKALVFTNYQGLTHVQIEGLKKKLKPVDADLAITKNTLLKIALKDNGLKIEDEKALENATSTIFIYSDIVAPLKELAKVIKELNLPEVKFGFLDKSIISKDQVLKLATLPSREVLIGQVVSGLKSPIFGLHRALSWNLQQFVMTLNAIQAKKS